MKVHGLLLVGIGCVLAQALPGCLGGQTGQPTSLDCAPRAIEGAASWSGTTPNELAAAFTGEYAGPLHWFEGTPGESSAMPVALDDELVLRVQVRAGASRVGACQDELHLPVSWQLTTSASVIAEAGDGELQVFPGDAPRHATFSFSGEGATLTGELVEGVVQPDSARLVPSTAGAPGDFAEL